MKSIKITFLIIILLMILFSTGCWDNFDITSVAIVTAVGVDKLDNGQLSLTLQVLKPAAVQPGMESGKGGKAYTNYTGTGLTLNEAHKKTILLTGRRPFYSHMQVIVFGEEVAKDGFTEVLDLFERQYDFNQTVKILIAKGMSSKEVLEAESEVENIPAVHLMNLVEANNIVAKIIDMPFFKLVKEIENEGVSPTVSAISKINDVKKPKQTDLLIGSAGVIIHGKLRGYIDENQVRSLLFLTNQIGQTLITTKNPMNPRTFLSVEITQSNTKHKLKKEDGLMKAKLTIESSARVAEVYETDQSINPEFISKIEKAIEDQIKVEVTNLIDTAQHDLMTDIFGLGEMVNRREHSFWMTVSNNWDKYFTEMPIDVNVDVKILKTGLINNPAKAR